MKIFRFCAPGLVAALVLPSLGVAVQPPPGGGYPDGNTALGQDALFSLATGANNTALGFEALYFATTAEGDTATGYIALQNNTTGSVNTADGGAALAMNTTGYANTGMGAGALFANTTGSCNTAVGTFALQSSTTAYDNAAFGQDTMASNQNGSDNSAFGYATMVSNTTGNYNVAIGDSALASETNSSNNTAVGYLALRLASGGSSNIALGSGAGRLIRTGSNNVAIASRGMEGDSGVIRIGTNRTQTSAYIAGISGTTISGGAAVMVSSDGQLGVMTSSARFKDDIAPMKDASDVLLSLKPVTFRYKKELDSLGTPQFGLVAEEVAKVDPDLVARDESGKPYTVRYEAVNAMLLNEFLKEHRKVEAQAQLNAQQSATIATQEDEIGELRLAVAALQKTVEAQAAQIQKVSARLQANETTPRLVLANP